MPIYNKLVRDNIPEIICQSNKTPVTHILDEEEYLAALDCKLNEECEEYQRDKSMEELADMLEVIYAIADARGSSKKELEELRQEKAYKRGSFIKRIFLESVEEAKGNTNHE